MGRLSITIQDPSKQQIVADALLSVGGGVKLERVTGPPRMGAGGKITHKLTPQEKVFVKELRQALEAVHAPMITQKKNRSARK